MPSPQQPVEVLALILVLGALSIALLSLAFRSPSRMITSVWDHSASADAQREGEPHSHWPLQSSPTFFRAFCVRVFPSALLQCWALVALRSDSANGI